MILKENYIELHIGKYFPDTFCVQEGNYYCFIIIICF